MRSVLLAVPLLAACVDGGASSDPGQITLGYGGGYYGDMSTTVLSDDTYTRRHGGGLLEEGRPDSKGRMPEGAYQRGRAVLAAKLPGVARRTGDELCEPHAGWYSITVSPPVAGITTVTDCTGGEVRELMHEVEAAMSG